MNMKKWSPEFIEMVKEKLREADEDKSGITYTQDELDERMRRKYGWDI